ncbi:ATP-binding cassette sub- A member 3 [Mactra antiquata]
MGLNLQYFGLLLWKNFLIQKRKVLTTVFEIGLPTFFSLILIFIRLRVQGEMKLSTTWPDCVQWDKIDLVLPRGVAYSPYNSDTREIMANVKKRLHLKVITGLQDEDNLVDFMMFANKTLNNTNDYLAGIVFLNHFGDHSHNKIEYKLRFSSYPRNSGHAKFHLNIFKDDTRWFTRLTFPLFQRVGPREPTNNCNGMPGYIREGFTAVQHAVNLAIMKKYGISNRTDVLDGIKMNLRRHPYPAYNDDNFVLVIQQQFPLIIMLSFVLVALNIVKDVIHEKERKLKESMKMMGLNNWLHWSAWFVKYFLFMLITVSIMTLFLCIDTKHGPVIGKTSPSVIFVFIILYAISTISYCFAVSVFFKKANSGAAGGGILFFILYIPYFFLQPRYQTLTWGQKLLTCLMSNVAMAYGGQIIGMFEGTGSGVQWNNINEPISVDDNFTMLNVFLMLIIDAVLYGFITWYVEAVFPGEFGVPQKWYFMFTSSYWCGTVHDEDITYDKRISIGQIPEYFEPDPVNINAGIQIRNLRKVYKTGANKNVAVCGMTLDMYEGQITALLGHNGAGKTTTMSMLTGFITPSSGTAIVNGYDIREDIGNVRSSLGLCPQHDVLFDTLTVEEHLIFFGKLKGCKSSEINGEVTSILQSIDLENKRHDQTKTLSGGMKRKLSVGIALIGGSKIVILDEPSSGMDPDARRHIWSVLQKNRAGRTMLLTTHFMDEADLLGDRVAIMADGVIKCCGTSLFLKNKYGAGYHLTMVKKSQCDISKITTLIQQYIPDSIVQSNVASELSYVLPHEMSQCFAELFSEIDEKIEELGIESYNVSTTTMEEVFLRVGESRLSALDMNLGEDMSKTKKCTKSQSLTCISVNDDESSCTSDESTPLLIGKRSSRYDDSDDGRLGHSSSFTRFIEKNSGMVLFFQQFYGMFIKRAIHTRRNKLVTITQLAVPLLFTIAALIVIKTFPGPSDSPPLNLTVTSVGDNVVVYSSELNNTEPIKHDSIEFVYGHQFKYMTDTHVTYVNNQTGFKQDSDMIKFLLKKGQDDIGGYNLRYLIGANFKENKDKTRNITAYFNNQAFHTPGISLTMLANALYKYVTNDTSSNILVTNHPLPRTIHDKIRDEMTSETTGFTVAFNIVFGMSFLASSFTLFLIRERSTKAKHLQFTSGINSFTFWSGTFCWDLINYLLPAILLLITLLAFDVDAYIVEDHLAHIALLFILYGFAMLPFMYLWSFLFDVPSTGYVWLTMFNILSGVATILAVGILSIPQLGLQNLSHILEWIFLCFLPNYCLGQGLEDYYSNYRFKSVYQEYCINQKFADLCFVYPNPCCRDVTGNCGALGCLDYDSNPLGWESNGIGRMLLFLCVQSVLYFTVLFLFESEIMHSLYQQVMKESSKHEVYEMMMSDPSMIQEDEDVARERARLANTDLTTLIHSDKLVLSELTKYYGRNLAVNGISVGIPQGECFGLLGINGAGKTTTFKMLTGDETVSCGQAYLDGYSITSQISEVSQKLGYCPQFNALIDEMTGRETLYMYARLRGIHSNLTEMIVNDLLGALLLTEHADKLVQDFSGGNKRKLSTAIALVGNPAVIFLDEPTTGMDPVARRFLWDTLCNLREVGRTLVLTSHSMEECEALCTRLAVMVNGQFKCLGSPQHLKSRFGQGYFLIARVTTSNDNIMPKMESLMKFIESKFPGSLLIDIHQNYLNYHITDTNLSLAEIFGTIEKAKAKFDIEDYSVSQTTLEQIFLNFARAQVQPYEFENKCCRSICICCGLCCKTRQGSISSN